MSTRIDLVVEDGVARIALDGPSRLNAIDAAAAGAFAEAAVAAAGDSEARAILLEGAGPSFCAGGDVAAMAADGLDPADVTGLARELNRGLLALLEAPVPVVAAAQGTTAGGGLGLLLCSDYAIVDRDARIGALYGAIGLTPDMAVTALLARAVGERRALALVLSERLLTSAEALGWGLVAEVVEDRREVRARAAEVARRWADGPAEALGGAKALVRRAGGEIAAQLEAEAVRIGEAFASAEARRRIAAFVRRERG